MQGTEVKGAIDTKYEKKNSDINQYYKFPK